MAGPKVLRYRFRAETSASGWSVWHASGRAFSAKEKSLLAMLSYCFQERLRNLAPRHGFAVPPVGLTKREIDTLQLIARGATDREIARKLGISPSTAHEHFETAKEKLKVSTRAEAIAIAVSLAIVAP
jgi:DNA-binding CsgD family transcriptional regulator